MSVDLKVNQDDDEEKRVLIRVGEERDASILASFNEKIAWETEEWKLENALAGVRGVLENEHRGFYLVAELDGAVRASCLITFEWSDWQAKNYWWIQSVYVEKEFRGQGLFRRLYNHVKKLAIAQGAAPSLRLYVEKDNESAQKVYSKLGMSPSHYLIFEQDLSAEVDASTSPVQGQKKQKTSE